ncbi:MAG: T9SS type A sorting domain-containing protein [Chitinophagaceae bacterium]
METYNDEGCSGANNGQFRFADANSVADASSAYTLFPNPNNGSFRLSSSGTDRAVKVKVYNSIGALVYQTNANFTNGQIVINTGQRTPGIYLVCIGEQQSKTTCLRFVIR